MHDADHAAVGVDHWHGVQVVLVEEFGDIGLVHIGGAGQDARLGENLEMAARHPDDHARQRYRAPQSSVSGQQVDLGEGLGVAIEFPQSLDGICNRCFHVDSDKFRGHAAGSGIFVELKKLFDFMALLGLHLFEDGFRALVG